MTSVGKPTTEKLEPWRGPSDSYRKMEGGRIFAGMEVEDVEKIVQAVAARTQKSLSGMSGRSGRNP